MQFKEIILTGDRPTGSLHLGHYVGSLAKRLELQGKYPQYIMLADVQALTDNYDRPEVVRHNIFEVALDYLAVGIDPQLATIFIQSQIPEIAELTVFFLNLVTIGRLQRNPTVKTEIKQKNFGESIPAGFFVYPVSQAADIMIVKATMVPVGADQLPMIEQTNEIARSFNRIYKTSVFPEVQALVPKAGSARLSGIDGQNKMSKSLGNAIFLSDDVDSLRQKIMRMYTDPLHLKVTDPGNLEGNTVFEYLDIFGQNQAEISELKAHYQRGGLGDVKVKQYLFEQLNQFLEPIRNRRLELAKDPAQVWQILKTGTEQVREIAANTMQEVRAAMHLDYY
ncbi:MAG TPA: tryptophan--tRNA ligase [Candidatus Babeliales bacterium]|nr:tryptophan--tRNA ligase [Candidatus Babeliales bacterium]